MSHINVSLPRGFNKKIAGGTVGMKWNPRFKVDTEKQFVVAQKVLDSEALRRNHKYMQEDSGTMVRSGTLHTVVGSGFVTYKTPYARRRYYEPSRNLNPSKPLAGRYHFKRMINAEGRQLLIAVRRSIKNAD